MLYHWATDQNVRRKQDIVRLPAPIQITPELPTATEFYSGI